MVITVHNVRKNYLLQLGWWRLFLVVRFTACTFCDPTYLLALQVMHDLLPQLA